jgi:hypothetical protein
MESADKSLAWRERGAEAAFANAVLIALVGFGRGRRRARGVCLPWHGRSVRDVAGGEACAKTSQGRLEDSLARFRTARHPY